MPASFVRRLVEAVVDRAVGGLHRDLDELEARVLDLAAAIYFRRNRHT